MCFFVRGGEVCQIKPTGDPLRAPLACCSHQVKLCAYRLEFFCKLWNWFDLLLVSLEFASHGLLRLFYLFFLASWNKHFVLKNINDNVLALYLLYFFSLSDSQSQKSIDSVRIQWTNPSMLSTQRLPYGSIALHPRWGMVMRKLSC